MKLPLYKRIFAAVAAFLVVLFLAEGTSGGNNLSAEAVDKDT